MKKGRFFSVAALFLALLTTVALAFAAVPPIDQNYAECTTPGGTLTTKVNLAFEERKPDGPDQTGCTLTFLPNNGQDAIIQTVPAGTVTTPPRIQDRQGYEFGGWFTDGHPVNFAEPVTQNMTITAKWTLIEKDPSYSVGWDTSYTIAKDASYTVEHYKQTSKNAYTLADSERFNSKENTSVTAEAKSYAGYTENLTHPDRVSTGTVKADNSLVLRLYYDRTAGGHGGTSSGGHVHGGSSSHRGGSTGGSKNSLIDEALNKKDHMQYISGYPDGTIRPTRDITRGEVAQIIYRLMQPAYRDSHSCDTNPFSDVDGNVWCNVPVSTLANAKLIKGYNDGTFGYNRSITRAEFVAMMSRFFAFGGDEKCPFTDIADHWAKTDIEKVASLGYIKGKTSTTFDPDAPITRAEAVAILNRILERGTKTEFMLENMKTWPDNLDGAWYYEDVQEASNGHEYETGDGHEVWTRLVEN